MTSRRILLAAIPAALLAYGPLARADEPVPYVTASQLDLTKMLPPAPARGSALYAAEVQAVLDAQASASPARIAQAVEDAKETVFVMFGGVLGPRFAAERLPKTTALFARIGASEDATVDPAKPFFGRLRPYLADDRIKALIPASKSGSWPSGHTTRVTMMAAILSSIVPGQRDAIWARAADYAQSRVIGGMHYPLDLEVGQRAGTAMAALMFADPAFRADLALADTELKAALAN